METEKIESEGIPWMDDLFNQSTTLPEVLVEETNQVGTVVIFVITAVLTITLLFVIAIFIDCRQQKLTNAQLENKKRILRIKIPKLRKKPEDEDTLTDKIKEPSSSNVIV